MKILAIETSTMLGGVAIMNENTLIAELRMNVKVAHSERIMSEIDHLLTLSGLQIGDIDVFAIAIGPGSFTGLRVGLSTAKGFVYATGKKLVALPSLEVLAWNVPFSGYQVCPIFDARKKEVYTAIFKWGGDGFVRILNEQVVKIEELLALIKEPTIFLGEGANLYKEVIQKSLGEFTIFAQPQNMVPSPSNLAYLGIKRAEAGEFDDPVTLVPMYMRRAEAEIKAGI